MAEEQLNQDLRLERGVPSRIERQVYQPEIEEKIPDSHVKSSHNISRVEAICVVCFAIILDIVSFVPGANDVGDLIANAVLIPWFFIRGIKFTTKRITSFGTAAIVEAIPFLSWAPMITINTVYCLYYSD